MFKLLETLKSAIFGTGSQRETGNGFVKTHDGNLSIFLGGKTYSVGKVHMNYAKILAKVTAKDFEDLVPLIDAKMEIQRQTNGLITVDSTGVVCHNGTPVHGVVANIIAAHFKAGAGFGQFARFLENTMLNPDPRAIDELYSFLEHGGFPLTHDGCFLAYKGVRPDFKDKHTGKIDNRPGAEVPAMKYEDVDNNRNVACSKGYHVGTYEYALGFAGSDGHLIMCKVNPKDAVSVPRDENCQKLRIRYYKPIALCDGKITDPLANIPDAPRLVPEGVEAATGRVRGPGGRFLPAVPAG